MPRPRGPARGRSSSPSFVEVLDDDAPYVLALYLLVGGAAAAFVDYGALAEGRLAYRTVGGGTVEALAAVFAAGFLLTTLLTVALAVDVFRRERRTDPAPYDLAERISLVAVLPALQLLTVVLCPVATGATVVAGLEFLLALA